MSYRGDLGSKFDPKSSSLVDEGEKIRILVTIDYFITFFLYRQNGKVIINSDTQSGCVGVRTTVTMIGLTISTFLS